MKRKRIIASLLAAAALGTLISQVAIAGAHPTRGRRDADVKGSATATPIKHLVVIFQENVSFDHYFGTYPYATNPPGEPPFHAVRDTPTVDGLQGTLLTNNPNSANPQRLDRSQALTCDQDHDYTAEQLAFDHGRHVAASDRGSRCWSSRRTARPTTSTARSPTRPRS